MVSEVIHNLLDRLSCDFMLADPEEPETLSGLLPILKQLHDRCRALGLDQEKQWVLKARKTIDDLLSRPGEGDEKMAGLGGLISTLSASLQAFPREDDRDSDSEVPENEPLGPLPDDRPSGPTAEPDRDAEPESGSPLPDLEDGLDRLASLIGSFCPGDIPDLGALIQTLDRLATDSNGLEAPVFHQVALACRDYADNMTLETIQNTHPLEEGLLLLRSIISHQKKGKAFIFDYSDVLELLHARFENPEPEPEPAPPEEEAGREPSAEQASISSDDMEILADFVTEAFENLETIEIKLIDLEQEPDSKDIINDIFRPFHTIKGVSGFLSLTKINKLAHATENLLDSARSGEFIINHTATDAILESVDTLKSLVERVKHGIQTGFWQPDSDIDIQGLLDKFQKIHTALSRGEQEPLGEILVRQQVVDRESVNQALETQQKQPGRKIGEILVEERKAEPGQIASALMEQTGSQKKVESQVKVSTQKLDDLVDFAGELVIAQAMLRQKTMDDPVLNQSVAHLGQIVTNMQNIAMSMRMIPIKATFMKMIRLVRDLSRRSGKNVNLQMSGEDTEIDRNVVDALYEPMVHMIRNSVDHGIERAEDRSAKGKAAQGNIFLRAYHKGGHIIIEIEDDGKGLDRDRILEKALSTGLISGNEQMTDAQIYDLIMEPGFSTAEKITDVSGRGVGMDVVKDGIEKFRGHLNIASKKDRGTKFTISLPLTLAIIDGMLVRVETEKYVIPTTAVQKVFKPGDKDYFTVEGKGEMVKDRGSLIPLIRLNTIYNTVDGDKQVRDCLVVVVESKDEKRAILIDELLGKDEYVIKSLGSGLENIKGIAGGAILSDGRVGLILDIHGIFSIAQDG